MFQTCATCFVHPVFLTLIRLLRCSRKYKAVPQYANFSFRLLFMYKYYHKAVLKHPLLGSFCHNQTKFTPVRTNQRTGLCTVMFRSLCRIRIHNISRIEWQSAFVSNGSSFLRDFYCYSYLFQPLHPILYIIILFCTLVTDKKVSSVLLRLDVLVVSVRKDINAVLCDCRFRFNFCTGPIYFTRQSRRAALQNLNLFWLQQLFRMRTWTVP